MIDRLTIFNRWRAEQTFELPTELPAADWADWLYLAAVAVAAGRPYDAYTAARHAGDLAPQRRLTQASLTYLHRISGRSTANVYDDGQAFGAFIRGGGNVGLYTALSTYLRSVYVDYPHLSLLDVGVGDGLALLPALVTAPDRLDLVEPSESMLGVTLAALAQRGIQAAAHNRTLQQFSRDSTAHWQIAQATFSLQTLSFTERPAQLAWLRGHSDRLLIAEFDAPDMHDPLHPEWFGYMAGRYERGLTEYDGDGGLVAQGFLMPVFWGAFASAQRANYEQPIASWRTDLHRAGFTDVTVRPFYDYWWAPAYVLDAR